jgi:thiol-disulfide isomerase/thioredoxin
MKRKGGGLKSSKTVSGLLVVFLILVILISVFFGFNRFRKEGFDNNNKFILVHMNGCGHCKDLMPIWEEASQSNTTPIRMKVVEMNEPEGKKLCDEHDIKSFPTMILIKNNTTTMYDGNRTKEGLLSFLNSNI